jgi:hypothetical protein
MACVEATKISAESNSPIGTLDCSNVVHRIIDKALFISNNTFPLQCDYAIGPYSNTVGELYGLFHTAIPDVLFNEEPWGEVHYDLIAQVTNRRRMDTFDGRIMDRYIRTWLDQVISNEDVQPITTYTVGMNDTGIWDALGNIGSRFFGLPMTTDIRLGRFTAFSWFQPIRAVRVYTPVALSGIQLLTQDRGVCASAFNISANSTVTLPCFSTPRTLAELLNYTITNGLNSTAAILEWPSSAPFILYHDGAENLTQVSVITTTTSYDVLWNDLSRQIIKLHQLPPNPYATATGALINVTDPDDQRYLRQFHAAYLAPRSCAADWMCRLADVGTCIFPVHHTRGWRNGLELAVTGDEGGCECFDSYQRGHWVRLLPLSLTLHQDPLFFCSKCIHGYGPVRYLHFVSDVLPQEDQETWNLAIQFQETMLLKYPDFVTVEGHWPLFDPNQTVAPRCNLPTYVTTRDTSICGGRGHLNTTVTRTTGDLVYFNKLTPSCAYISVDRTYPMINMNDSIITQSFFNGTHRINVIQDQLYVRQPDRRYIKYDIDHCMSNSECVYTHSNEKIYVQCIHHLNSFFEPIGRWY